MPDANRPVLALTLLAVVLTSGALLGLLAGGQAHAHRLAGLPARHRADHRRGGGDRGAPLDLRLPVRAVGHRGLRAALPGRRAHHRGSQQHALHRSRLRANRAPHHGLHRDAQGEHRARDRHDLPERRDLSRGRHRGRRAGRAIPIHPGRARDQADQSARPRGVHRPDLPLGRDRDRRGGPRASRDGDQSRRRAHHRRVRRPGHRPAVDGVRRQRRAGAHRGRDRDRGTDARRGGRRPCAGTTARWSRCA